MVWRSRGWCLTSLVDDFVSSQRCNQENLIEQLKNGVHALHAPVNTLNANGAYMLMASLAWTLKAWFALCTPLSPRWKERHAGERETMLRMEFRAFFLASASSEPMAGSRFVEV